MSDIARRGQSPGKHLKFRAVSALWLLVGLTLAYLIASLLQWRSLVTLVTERRYTLLTATFLGFLVIAIIVRYVRRFALVNLWAVVIFVVAATGGVQALVVAGIEQSVYALFHGTFYFLTLLTILVWVRIIKKVQYLRLAFVPYGVTQEVKDARHHQLELFPISEPSLKYVETGVDGVVVDTRVPLEPRWVRFLAACRLKGLRVYQAEELFEAITGRISLSHLSHGIVDDFPVNAAYQVLKRLLDLIGVLITLPLTLAMMAATAVAVRAESPGRVFFVQPRVGQGGRPFRIIKFRSMTEQEEGGSSHFTSANDRRITRVGSFIRKYRIDEVPQIWNVVRGEMSLIGPRPEQPQFVGQFNESIPYYNYRHIVKPGLTGWAQVTQGYVADAESTRDKLEYDLYYIKHQSFWLDLLIVFKTVKTIMTGFGAR